MAAEIATLREQLATAQAETREVRRIAGIVQKILGAGQWRHERGDVSSTWSDQVYTLHGLTRTPFQENFTLRAQLYHPDDNLRMGQVRDEAYLTGEPFSLKVRMKRADDGEQRIVVFTGEAERDEAGEVRALVGVMHDITETENERLKVEAERAQYRLLADSATDLIMKSDFEGVLQYISPSVRRYGFEPSDLIGTVGAELVHPDDRAHVRALVAELFSGAPVDPTRDRTYRVRDAQGGYFWVEGNPAIIRNQDGKPEAMISQLRDVTERHMASKALAESEMRYRLLTNNATDVIACYGLDGVFTFVSPAVTTTLGYTPQELVGLPASAFIHPDDIKDSNRHVREHLLAGPDAPPAQFTYRANRKDGTMLWMEAHPKATYHSVTGEFIEFQDVVRDVTARVAMEAELRAARDEAQSATAVKTDFMANMSHEIRTPLTAILGFTSLLASRPELETETKGLVARVSGAGQALLSIVNDVLDFSKLEAGQVEIKPRPTCPQSALDEALMMFQPQADTKGLKLEFDVDGLPAGLGLDPDRLRQVLLNLIGNAVKFTEQGSVRLSARYAPETARFDVEIADSGVGIAPAQQKKLFMRFSQVDASSTRKHGGTGLGLAISKGLVEAMGGEIGVRSNPRGGSIFFFHITAPLADLPEARDEAGLDQAFDLEDLRVLVVDDNPTNRELARVLMERLGVEVSEAEDGAAALEIAAAYPFDVILLDLHMPGLSGAETLAAIRRISGPNQDAPVLAFTADGDLSRLEPDHGFDGVVRKPMALMELISALRTATRWDAGGETEELSNVVG